MARASVSKSRGVDKSKPPASQTPAVTHEIVPGKFNDADWNLMLNRDGNDEYIAELVNEIIDATMGVIFKKYLDRQLFPFTITQAKDAIVEIIEWYFLVRDDGEQQISSDLGWIEDEEPESADTDCWAQGSIPKNVIAAPPVIMTEISEVPEDETVVETGSTNMEAMPQVPSELPDAVSDTEEINEIDMTHVSEEATASKMEYISKHVAHFSQDAMIVTGSKKKIKIYGGHELKKLSDDYAESFEKPTSAKKVSNSSGSFHKAKSSQPAINKDALYDDMGNVIAVPKLDPEKLPTHRVNVKYVVIDPVQETVPLKVDLKKKYALNNKQKSRIVANDSDVHNRGAAALSVAAQEPDSRTSKLSRYSTARSIQPAGNVSLDAAVSTHDEDFAQWPSMCEEIELSQGITIREGERVKKGPGRYYRKLDILENVSKGMKPVNLRITNPGITVADLLDRQSPILRPYGDLSPLPPIVPHSQHLAKKVSTS